MPLDPIAQGDPHVPAHNEERAAINALNERIEDKITIPAGLQTGDLLVWDGIQLVSTETRFFEGEGRPDGNVGAPVGSRYIDKTGAQGAVEWVKRAGGSTNVGWICLAGDTGWRDISAIIDRGNGTIHTAQIRRIGHLVDFYLDVTMPSNKTTTWTLFSTMPGFSPGIDRYGTLTDNQELAANGNYINDLGGIAFTGVLGGKRDRYSGTWSTSDAWPSPLPGAGT